MALDCNVILSGGTFSNNSSGFPGGGICFVESSYLSADDCTAVAEDGVAVAVRFKRGKKLPASNVPVRLRFHIDNASLYAFWTE